MRLSEDEMYDLVDQMRSRYPTSYNQDVDFEPHEWVKQAMYEAYVTGYEKGKSA